LGVRYLNIFKPLINSQKFLFSPILKSNNFHYHDLEYLCYIYGMQLTPKRVILPAIFIVVSIALSLPLLVSSSYAFSASLDFQSPSSAADANFLLSDNFPENIQQWKHAIEECAAQNEIPADLVGAVILQESGGNPTAISSSGAIGLMQVMPKDGKAAEFLCAAGPCFYDRPESEALFDPEFNIAFGCDYLSGLLERSGSTREALRLYGPMDVAYDYADIVLDIYDRFR
jgi:soluble lytic murein transglycosylase-like protein